MTNKPKPRAREDKFQWRMISSGFMFMAVILTVYLAGMLLLSFFPSWLQIKREQAAIQRTRLVIDKCPDSTGMYLWLREWCDREIESLRGKAK